jgi:hypothetical protein
MKLSSRTTLILAIAGCFAGTVLLICRLIGVFEFHRLAIVIGLLVGTFSAISYVLNYIKKPFIKEYSEWTVLDVWDRKKVFIEIPKSVHGFGRRPKYCFIDKGLGYGTKFEVEENDGNLKIYNPENSFMPPFKKFVIKITD